METTAHKHKQALSAHSYAPYSPHFQTVVAMVTGVTSCI